LAPRAASPVCGLKMAIAASDQAADRQHRDRRREVGDDVEAAGRQAVQLALHDRPDVGLHPRHAAGERGLDRVADAGVVGIVHPADAAVAVAGPVHVGRLEAADQRALLGAVGVLPLGRIGEPGAGVCQPGQREGAAARIVVDLLVRPHLVEHRLPLIDALVHARLPLWTAASLGRKRCERE
jgi:hypothetical protein